ncbi:MAG: acyltransferase [Ferruginibacter sp.]
MNKIQAIFKIEIDKKRIYGLDIIRCFAILTVVLTHSFDLLPNSKENKFINLLPFPDGVAVFFVLSGFLIGGILIKVLEKKEYSFNTLFNFWKRRWLRTLPNYYFVLLIIIAVTYFVTGGFIQSNVFLYFIFCQNITGHHPPFFTEVWSLSAEEWFYLLVPMIIFSSIQVLRITPKKAVLLTIIAIIIFTILFRFYRYQHITVTSVETYGSMFRNTVATRLDNIMFGVLGAYIAYYFNQVWIKYKNQSLIAGITICLLTKYISFLYFPTSAFYWCNLSFIFAELAILLCFPFFSQVKSGDGKVYKFVTYTSLIAYSMYLVHGALILHLIIARIHFLQQSSFVMLLCRYTIFWITIYLVSILQYKYFEKPIMSIRNKKVINTAANSVEAHEKQIKHISKSPV